MRFTWLSGLCLAFLAVGVGGETPSPPAPGAAAALRSSPHKESAKSRLAYVSELPDLNQYALFANNGPDGNWRVGYRKAWFARLGPAPKGYAKAFLGAKLGRMKTRPLAGRKGETEPIPGEIWIAVSPEPRWSSEQQFLLTRTEEIPQDTDDSETQTHVGEARWFWVEVPAEILSAKANYLALYSPSPTLNTSTTTPVLAAGLDPRAPSKETRVWMNDSLQGALPDDPLQHNVSYYQPALVIKLTNPGPGPVVELLAVKSENTLNNNVFISASLTGQDVQCAWVEALPADGPWRPVTPRVWGPPYTFTVPALRLPPTTRELRVKALDVYETPGASRSVKVQVSRNP